VARHIGSDLLYVARHVDSSLLITQYSGGIAACSIKVRHGVVTVSASGQNHPSQSNLVNNHFVSNNYQALVPKFLGLAMDPQQPFCQV
jgi:hypothetical protein